MFGEEGVLPSTVVRGHFKSSAPSEEGDDGRRGEERCGPRVCKVDFYTLLAKNSRKTRYFIVLNTHCTALFLSLHTFEPSGIGIVGEIYRFLARSLHEVGVANCVALTLVIFCIVTVTSQCTCHVT